LSLQQLTKPYILNPLIEYFIWVGYYLFTKSDKDSTELVRAKRSLLGDLFCLSQTALLKT